MPIYVQVDADPDSCSECVAALDAVANGVDEETRTFGDARSSSESAWGGVAADKFRERIDAIGKVSAKAADQARSMSKALQAFVDEINTAKQRMRQAAAIAMEGGSIVGPDPCDVTWIGDPQRAVAVGPISPAQAAALAKQEAAYAEALAMAGEGRKIEIAAHAKLRADMTSTQAETWSLSEEFKDEAPVARGRDGNWIHPGCCRQARTLGRYGTNDACSGGAVSCNRKRGSTRRCAPIGLECSPAVRAGSR